MTKRHESPQRRPRPNITFSTEKRVITITPDNLGHNLAMLRRTLGYTQRDIQDECGVSCREMNRLERGQRLPKLTTIFTLLDALGYELRICKKK